MAFGYIYGDFCCNELGCESVFHKQCASATEVPADILEKSNVHDHPIQLSDDILHEANNTSHPQHPLKLLAFEVAPDYADKKCLLCGNKFKGRLHHCDVCNFSICGDCMRNPPPLGVVSPTTHEHQLHLVPRRIEFTCNACGTLVDGFYGAYSCSKCSNYVVHSRCATSQDAWDMIELEGTPEEPEEAAPFEICSEPFYSCEQCDFLLHQKCANMPRKKRHICDNLPLTLDANDTWQENTCLLCKECFTGFRSKSCNECGERVDIICFSCDECDYSLDFKCALIPLKVMRHRYDDHPLYLSYGESCADGEYWCEACETRVNSKKWLYTCNDCGVILHISCVVGDFSHVMPGSGMRWADELVPNTSVCRPICSVCNSRCKLPSVLKVSKPDVVLYFVL
ncbi:unnamed protein product [Arabidopsis lyrata]|nr:unnamed protein product [Arabidopsis lyrata]